MALYYCFNLAKAFSILFLLLILVIVTNNNDNVSSQMSMVKEAQATFTTLSFHPDSNTATITNIQLPGIIPNNSNNPTPATPSSSSDSSTTPNPAGNSPASSTTPLPSIIHRNTRARAAIGGPSSRNMGGRI